MRLYEVLIPSVRGILIRGGCAVYCVRSFFVLWRPARGRSPRIAHFGGSRMHRVSFMSQNESQNVPARLHSVRLRPRLRGHRGSGIQVNDWRLFVLSRGVSSVSWVDKKEHIFCEKVFLFSHQC